MARRKTRTRRYTNEQRREVFRRVKAGETQTAIAAETGVPAATVSYWSRKAGIAAASTRRTRTTGKRKRSGARGQRTAATSRSGGIAWTLDGNTLVIRIPLRTFARQLAEEALAKI